MAEGARLESVYTATYRGFESPPHRHIRDESLYESTGSFLLYSPLGGMRTPDRGSTTGAASWTDRARSKRAAPQGRAKRVNPPLTAIFEMRARTKVRAFFFYILRKGGIRTLKLPALFMSGGAALTRPTKSYSSTIFAYSSVRKSTSVLTDGSMPRREG